MNPSILQRAIDEIQDTSRQQWLLIVVSVCAPLATLLAATASTGRWWPLGLVVVAGLAAASAFRPDTHIGAGVVGIVVWHWLATVDDATTPWLPVAASLLLVYHSTIAASATVPTGGDLPVAVVITWLERTALMSAGTFAMWLLVAVFERRDAAGNGALTALALGTIAISALLLRGRSLGQPQRP